MTYTHYLKEYILDLLYIFTFDYSLEVWEKSGALERESKYFSILQEQNINIKILTYGDNSEYDYQENIENVEIIPIYKFISKSNSKIIRYLKSFYIPFYINSHYKFDVIKQNQLLGSWVAIILKFISGKKLLFRSGYDMYLFSLFEKKFFVKVLLYKLLTYFTLKYSDIYIVTSNSDKKFLNDKFKKIKNLEVISNWVETPANIKPVSQRSSKNLLSVGRLEYQKNFELLIKSFSHSDFDITIYGEGSKKKYLKKISEEEKVNVEFKKIISNSKLQQVYQQHTFFILTSFFEGNPKVLLEAMANGCVVIASNISNHSEIINHKVNGFLVNLNEKDIFNLVKEIIENKELSEEVSIKAVNFVRKNYSLLIHVKKEISLLKKLI